jgi:hypothetical protein
VAKLRPANICLQLNIKVAPAPVNRHRLPVMVDVRHWPVMRELMGYIVRWSRDGRVDRMEDDQTLKIQ